jgi:hypothetical protein
MNTKPEKSADVVSLSGSPIYRHGEELPWAAPKGEEFIEQISAHIEKYLGPVETVFHELVSDKVHIDIHFVKPTADFPYVRLVTSGMSDLPMRTPDDDRVPKYTELLITLPPDWKLAQSDMEDERWYWPIRLLKVLARLPHQHETWLGWGHTVPHGDPPGPYAANTKFCGVVVLPSATVPPQFDTLTIEGVKDIVFYSVVPLYEREMNLKLRSGLDAMLAGLARHEVSDIVDLKRKDTTAKRFGLW